MTGDEGSRRRNLPFPLGRPLLEMGVGESRVTLSIDPEGVLRLIAESPWGVDANRVGEGVGQLMVGEWRIVGGRLPSGASLVEVRAGDGRAARPSKRDNLVWLSAVPAREAVEIVFTGSGSRVLGTARLDPWEEPRVQSSLASRLLAEFRRRAKMRLPRSSIRYGPK
jgi:hypothetical protein